MIVAGLTGSIAMGKSTVAAMFAALGAPVFDADAAVRSFYAGKGREPVEAMFPGVLAKGGIDRDRFRRRSHTDKARPHPQRRARRQACRAGGMVRPAHHH